MNTITKSASTNVILAIDLGKYKSVACVHDDATGEFRFTTFDTTRSVRIVDPMAGKSYVEKRRVRYNEPGQLRELTFSCYRHYAFLGRDRTTAWFFGALV